MFLLIIFFLLFYIPAGINMCTEDEVINLKQEIKRLQEAIKELKDKNEKLEEEKMKFILEISTIYLGQRFGVMPLKSYLPTEEEIKKIEEETKQANGTHQTKNETRHQLNV